LNAGDISVSSIANGTSNVDIVGVSGNVTTSVNGTANVARFLANGVSVAGNVSVSAGNYYLGDGSLLTGIQTNTNTIFNGTSNITIGSSGGNANITIGAVSNVVVITSSGLTAVGNVTGGNLQATGNIFIGNTVFTRTLVVGTRTTPVTVALASNNSFLVGTRSSGNITVFTT
jgi:hypothetical protein